jgi:Domain of unknown function (DUF932)
MSTLFACRLGNYKPEKKTMKKGMGLLEMATELERQSTAKRDFIAPNSMVAMTEPEEHEKDVKISLEGTGSFRVTDYAHGQIASYTGIPKQYYDRLRTEDPSLLTKNVNRWLHDTKGDDALNNDWRMLRTLDGNARAFLSRKYRPLDNFDLAEAALPILMKQGSGLRVESSALTEQRMYIKAVTERLTMEVKRGDVVQAGIVISNSEVGAGSVKVEPMVFRLSCLNGAIAADASLRKYHVRKGHGGTEAGDVSEFFRDATRQADDRAFFMKVQDVIKAAFDEMVFKQLVAKMTVATQLPITGDPVKVIEVTAKRFNLRDTERASMLRKLIEGADLSQYGLLNAVTATAQDEDLSYERATELERIGGEIIELAATDWKAIAAAA